MSVRLGIYSQAAEGGIVYNSQAQAIFNQMTANGSEPSGARKNIINQLVLDLKGIGNTGSDDVWSIFDVLQILCFRRSEFLYIPP